MREALLPYLGLRLQVTATVARFGTRPTVRDLYLQTVLLRDVATSDGARLCDHLWMVVGARLAAPGLAPGDTIAFVARVSPYVKARVYRKHGRRVVRFGGTGDYHLAYPTNVRKIDADG